MKDERLETLLTQALNEEITEEELKEQGQIFEERYRTEQEYAKGCQDRQSHRSGRKHPDDKTGVVYRFPVKKVAAACLALVLVLTGGVSVYQNVWSPGSTDNRFYVTVQAKGKKQVRLESGKEVPVFGTGKTPYQCWFGEEDGTVQYAMPAPFLVEGKQIDTITYQVNEGTFEFNIPEKEDISNIIVGGELYEGEHSAKSPVEAHEIMSKVPGSIYYMQDGPFTNEGERYITKYYSSYTVSADHQPKDIEINLCGFMKPSKKEYRSLFPWVSGEKPVIRKLLKNVSITCTVKYKDGKEDIVKIGVGVRFKKVDGVQWPVTTYMIK